MCAPVFDALALPALVLTRRGEATCSNTAWREWFGEVGPDPWGALASVVESDRERVHRVLDYAISSYRSVEVEFEAYRQNGAVCSLLCSASPYHDPEFGEDALACVCWDVTERRHEQERLAFMAGHDPLTGLANRRAFEESLVRAVSRAERGKNSALLMVDLDHLKELNDARGHLEGDQALINLGLLLRRYVRSTDVPARIGGDEFAVILEDASVDDALEIAERVRVAVAAQGFLDGANTPGLGVSGGVAEIEGGIEAKGMLDRADAALYAAKAAGRNCIVRWDPSALAATAPERMASRVRSAFAEDGFFLVHQPVIDLADGSVAYFESLARMRGADGSVIGPAEFLPVVDRLGLMPNLTRRVIELALWELAATPNTSVSINLSGSDLADRALLEDVLQAIEAADAARGRLLFEISESTLLANLGGGRAWMERLTPAGCRFVLDDFGTGIGMFVLLREPRIVHVKLSRTVMRSMREAAENRVFVGALRELIESQGKTAVADFLETDDLLADARYAGFAFGQGYHLRMPEAGLARLASRLDLDR